jgi:hypothetical protein
MEELLEVASPMGSVSYRKKIGDYFFPELFALDCSLLCHFCAEQLLSRVPPLSAYGSFALGVILTAVGLAPMQRWKYVSYFNEILTNATCNYDFHVDSPFIYRYSLKMFFKILH